MDIQQVKPGAVICDCSRPLDISKEEAESRPDVMVIESGEVTLPGPVQVNTDLGLPKPSVYACLAETVLLTLEGRYESFSLGRELNWENVKEIYKIAVKHGAKLSEIRNHSGVITEQDIQRCRREALKKLQKKPRVAQRIRPKPNLKKDISLADSVAPEQKSETIESDSSHLS